MAMASGLRLFQQLQRGQKMVALRKCSEHWWHCIKPCADSSRTEPSVAVREGVAVTLRVGRHIWRCHLAALEKYATEKSVKDAISRDGTRKPDAPATRRGRGAGHARQPSSERRIFASSRFLPMKTSWLWRCSSLFQS